MVPDSNSFAKTICSICYEDLKPIVEDLQSISVCGHVFHELCLLQWFEYCSRAKKYSCPVCNQSCLGSDVRRLYFQSVGDQNEPCVSQKVIDGGEAPEFLRGKVRRLEGKVAGLSSIVERQGNEIKQLNEELYLCKDKYQKEVVLRNDAMEKRASMQQLLRSKSEELDALKLELLNLQDRNMALAKELAALKLVSDLNLDEDEVLKFASFGNEVSSKDTIDVLRKSLVIRNKSYKDLMAKCNQLGRGEARSREKLEKAKEKINKLKMRVQELETLVEGKDNEALRTLKVSKKNLSSGVILKSSNDSCDVFSTNYFSSEDQKQQCSASVSYLDGTTASISDQHDFNFINDISTNSTKECVISNPDSKHSTGESVKATVINPEGVSDVNKESKVHGLAGLDGPFGVRTCMGGGKGNNLAANTGDEITLILDDTRQDQPKVNIKNLLPSSVLLPKPGDVCFSGGLLGPDGTNRYLGKWCKNVQSRGSMAPKNTSSGDLIAVGSDGRGGRIKVLRSLNKSSMNGNENYVSGKRCKYGAKASSVESQGCLQIEHFFGRTNH